MSATKKKWPGIRTKPRPKTNLIGDSYQADPADLKKVKRIAKKLGISKAEFIRAAISKAIEVHEKKAAKAVAKKENVK